MQKRIQIIFIAAFGLMITMPFVLYSCFAKHIDTTNYENRALVNVQDIQAASFAKKPAKIDDFVNDHAPFKNQFLGLNAYINYKVFNCIKSDEVLLGKDNWLFYKNVSDSKSIDDYQGINAYNAQQLQDIARALSQLNDLLKAKDTELCLLIAPNKEGVYASFMPESIPVVAPSKANQLFNYLKQNTIVKVLFPQKELMETTAKQQTYYKYDTHWNNAGAVIALQQISPVFNNCVAQQAQGEPQVDLAYLSATHKLLPKDTYYEINGNVEHTEQDLLMLHDSFGAALIPQLEKAYNCTFVHSSSFDELDVTLSADLFVIETSERFLDNLLPRLQSMIDKLST